MRLLPVLRGQAPCSRPPGRQGHGALPAGRRPRGLMEGGCRADPCHRPLRPSPAKESGGAARPAAHSSGATAHSEWRCYLRSAADRDFWQSCLCHLDGGPRKSTRGHGLRLGQLLFIKGACGGNRRGRWAAPWGQPVCWSPPPGCVPRAHQDRRAFLSRQPCPGALWPRGHCERARVTGLHY